MTDKTDSPLRVVPISAKPPLSDVPGRLRDLASMIEAGEFGAVRTALVVLERIGPKLSTLCYGENPERPHLIGLLHMAAAQRHPYPSSDDDDDDA